MLTAEDVQLRELDRLLQKILMHGSFLCVALIQRTPLCQGDIRPMVDALRSNAIT